MADRDENVDVSLNAKNVPAFQRAMKRAKEAIENVEKASKKSQRESNAATRATSRLVAGFASLTGRSVSMGITTTTHAVGGMTKGLTAAAGAGSFFGVKLAASMEQLEVSFTTMLGSEAKAMAKLQELQAFAAKTPFTFTGLAESSRRLLALGFTADELIPTLTAVGDAAAALGGGEEAVTGITRALGQMRMKGRLSAEEINQQLAEWGINGWQYLAEASGKSAAQVMKDAEKGLISGRAASDVILRGLGNDPRFQGMMEKQNKTFSGQMSNFRDKAEEGARKAFRPLTDELTTMMPGAIKLSGKAFDWLGGKMQKGVSWFQKQKPAIKAFGTGLKTAFQAGGARGVAQAIDAQFGGTGKVVGLFDSLVRFGGAAKDVWLNVLWPAVKKAAPVLLDLLKVTVDVLTGLYGWAVGAKGPILGFFDGVLAVAKVLIKTIEVLQSLMNGSFWGKAAGWIKQNRSDSPTGFGTTGPSAGGGGFGTFTPPPPSGFGGGSSFMGPRPPGLSSGGSVTRGGVVRVGERGREERLILPPAAKVQPLRQGDDDLGSLTAPVIGHLSLRISGASAYDSKKLADVVVKEIRSKVARK